MRAANAILMAFLCLWGAARPVSAQDGPGRIRWRGEQEGVVPRAAQQEAASDVLDASADRHVVLQFKQVPGPKEQAKLQAKGVSLLRYLGDNAWFARIKDAKGAKEATGQAGLHSAMRIKRDWKLHPRLIRGEIPPYAKVPVAFAGIKPDKKAGAATETPTDILALYVLFHPDIDLEKTGVGIVTQHRGRVRALLRSINGAVIWLPSANLAALADDDGVEWIELPLPHMDVTNDGVRVATQANLVQAPPYGLNGQGVNVLVYDGGTIADNHPDLEGRVFVHDNSGQSDHSTHVAGTLGGNGAASGGLFAGMAPAVLIQSFGINDDNTGPYLYSNPGDLESDYTEAVNKWGAVIANNSVGTNVSINGLDCNWEGDYGATDMLIDSMVCGSLGERMRIVWANGNERGSGHCGTGYHTTAPPSCAKDHITVGAINSNDDSMTNFSSWGPTDDGRLKPDVCAPGCQYGGDSGVTSTVLSGGYLVMCGTSMAAPAVTGVAALILQDWAQQFPGQPLPSNAMLKVLLTHNAVDLGEVGPDYKFGFGAIRAKQTIDFMRSRSFAQGAIEQGQQLFYFLPITDSGQSLKVTLAWDDPPGALNAVPELVDDLDLKLISPSGVTYYPWTLDPANPAAPAVRDAPDRRNNIEQVVVDNPEAGSWAAVVQGYSVPMGPQAFAMATTPELRTCAPAGVVTFKSRAFGCASKITMTVDDCDLDTDSNVAETVQVTVKSTSEPEGETLVLTETSPLSANFEGSLPTSSVNAPGVLQVASGDSLTVTYVDASDGHGGTNVVVTDQATVDCVPPVVSNIRLSAVTFSSADIAFTCDEPTSVQVRYGKQCANASIIASGRTIGTNHVVSLTGLEENTQYFYIVEVDDEAGNRTVVDNGGACFTFTTVPRQDYFTELFGLNEFDLEGKALTFVPAQTIHRYTACLESITALPVNTAGSAVAPLPDDGSYGLKLAGGKKFPFYGNEYDTVYIGSNGFITFISGDSEYNESLSAHFKLPRISVMFDDFNPQSAGAVRWLQLPDRLAITWDRVPEYGIWDFNTFQVVLGFDGTIQMAWLSLDSTDGLVGLSPGGSMPSDFVEDDLSIISACVGLPSKAFDPRPADLVGDVSVISALSWQAGWRASTHEIYLGTHPDALELKATQPGTNVTLPTFLNNQTYYWRVDEVNSSGRTPGDVWSFTTKRLKPDFDQDGDVDMTDYAHMQLCFTGVDQPQNLEQCKDARMDGDLDVDETDADLLTGCLSGPGRLAVGSCLP